MTITVAKKENDGEKTERTIYQRNNEKNNTHTH